MAAPELEPIAVIGMACRFPGGSDSPSKLWDMIQSPPDLSERVPKDRFDSTAYFHPNGSYHGATDSTDAYFLEEDVTLFDNAFFNIQPAEAEAIDPQQRLLMETVYDSLCAGGHTIEGFRGSKTAVYVGMMCDDWAQLINRDWEATLTYAATGESRAIVSNRVSYFFDWHGPSMTIDTACSSSLVAVHQGVTALRNGECPVAIAAGANLILSPGMWIAESKLHMLSPTGSSKMWDESADGYARGEGIAAIVMKTLSDALRDGDPIDCVIRGTGVNQDGRTAGLTMPSNIAQAELIRDTYARSGLDVHDVKDRPQFFHAHGTGTQAGDPQEAQAISSSFFGDDEKVSDKLLVGSIKTIIGHTEGSAGLASLISTALALQHATIPPNLHFVNLNSRVAPFYSHLEIPTSARPWPSTVPGQPRRASVNSFGFGGTNAHAILESFEPISAKPPDLPAFTPLTISAASSSALRTMLSDLGTYLETHPDANMHDLAHTLQSRRSTLSYRTTIMCGNREEVISRIDALLADDMAGENGLTIRHVDVPNPKILGVFTGQGAQWPQMGAELIKQSPYVAERISELERALSSLPEGDRPAWSLRDELLADAQVSRLSEAAIAQPLCTAIQIILVDLFRAANIKLSAVVGHSSGEIGAAYAAGFLSATNAIRVAYYRGLFAHLARSESGVAGAMVAIGTSIEDAVEFCELEEFHGRIQVAARNSSTSITLSGDEDAVDEAEAIFKDESKFARKLKVDTAYHSHHMLPCSAPYLDALARCGITADEGNDIPWFSSVVEGQVVTKENFSPSQYWADNMTNAVLFAPAIEMAIAHVESFDMAIEFGPHPALKGPSLDTIEAAAGKKIPYIGLLGRGKNDVNEFSLAVGTVWTQLGSASVNFDQFERQISGASLLTRRVLADLPTYPFDHVRQFYSLTRSSGGFRNVHARLHPLLGRRCVETETDSEISWRQLLRPHEIRWLHGHQLQGQLVFPAMGYVVMAVEAAVAVAGTGHGRKIGLISLEDVVIDRAITFGEQDSGVECKITMTVISFTSDELSARITTHSGLPFDAATPLALNFSATVKVMFHEPASDTLPASRVDEINLIDAQPERLYSQFTSLGYNYSSPFTAIRAIHRKMDFATGDLEDESDDNWEDQLLVHPGFLDSALQTGFAAYSHPHDKRLWALYVPTYIRSIVINPFFLPTHGTGRTRSFQYQSASRDTPELPMVVDIDIFAGEGQAHPFVQFDTVGLKPFAAAGPRDDSIVFSRCYYQLATVDAAAVIVGGDEMLLPENAGMLVAAERIGFFYLRRLYESITPEEKANTLSHYQRLLENASRLMDVVKLGQHPTVPREAMTDSSTYIRSLISKYHQRVFVQLLEVVGEHLEEEVRRNGTMLEHMMKDGLLDQFYEELAGPRGIEAANTWYGRLVAQIAHRYPRMHLFEIGAGTGGATRDLLPTLGTAFASYTYTDISAGFFERAQQSFADYNDRMVFATYDMERPPAEQGFEEGSYDIVLAAAVLHVTGKLDEMMANIRRLLKPGGYLIVVDIIDNDFLSIGTIMGGLPGWWAGAEVDSNRSHGPCLSIAQWDALSRKHGFGGVETHTPTDHKLQYYSVFACQAVDERVVSLRNPLAAPAHAPSPAPAPALASSPAPAPAPAATATRYPRHLVVVGGRKVANAQLAEETCALLSGRYEKITRVDSLEELHVVGLATGSSVLSLTELDQQYLEVRSAAKLEALKTLWRNSRSILYVTRGAQAESPYSAILLGLSRVVRFEYPNINMQILDFDAATTPSSQILAESLLRLELGYQWKREEEGVNLLWSLEPELHYVEGQPLIPRVYPIRDANRRYNTSRRTIRAKVSLREETVVLDTTPNGKAFELSTVSPLRVVPAPRTKKTVTLQVQTSLLWAVKVHEAGLFSLCIGEDVETSEQLIALVDVAVESLVRVPLEWTARTSGESLAVLGSIAVHLLTQSILAAAPRSGIMLVHEADEVLKDALEREAAMEGVQILFTTAVNKPKTKSSSPSLFVHSKLPMRMVQRLVPRQTSLFINFSPACEAGKLLVHCLPSSTPTYTTEDFLCARPGAYLNVNVDQVGRAFKVACQTVTVQRRATSQRECIPVVSLQDVVGLSTVNAKLSVVDWKSPSVEVSLRPIDHGTIFRADGTYLLFGLAGELGQSLCTWMVAHGARHIMIGSRRPRVDPRFIESLAIQGANIRVMPVDITSRESLRSCYYTICAEMPQVIGVANGALILEDSLFDDLEFESLQRTSQPKIEGSLLLDELFYDTPLDFFVLFTSAVNIMGNTGQSSYIMANQFMTALAAQRREIRGVVGSDMALAAVSGLGFFEHADLDKDHFTKMGYQNASEQDFHQQFAETVLVGRPRGDKGISQVVTGLAPFRLTPHIQAQLREDPKFGHYILQDAGVLRLAGGDGGGSTARARVRLAGVTTRSEASTVVREAFMQRLKRILMIPPDEAVNETITFVEQGVDSIMAVEIRTWFLSELEVDIPVLKILGSGSNVQALLDEAMGKISASILDWEKLAEGGNDCQTSVKPAALSVTAETISSPTLSSASLTTPETPPDMGTSTPTSITATDMTSTSSMEIKPAVFLAPATSAKTPETNELSQALQWRNQIVESSTEHKEQMTYGQSRFWFLTLYVDDPTTFNGAFMFKLTGPIRVKDLARAVETVGQRHEALRTRFFWSDDESKTPMQGILSKSLVRLETATIKSEAEAVMNLEAMRDYVWDLGDWIPARLRLLSISDTLHYFLMGTHHISVDGHSFTVMMMEIDHAYSNPHRPLPPMPVTSQARAFGAHQLAAYQSGRFKPAIDSYRRMLPPRDLTRPIELFSFARTQVRSPLDRYETHVTRRVLDPSTVAKLKQVARGRRSTSFHAYLAAFQAMLFHLLPADTTDKVFIGMADANRIDSNFMGSVGNFLNVLPLRFDRASRRQTFGEAVEAARTKVYSALEHSALPFDLLLDELAVPRSNTWPPVFQVFVDYRLISNQQADPTWAGCRRSEEKWFPSRSSYDVVLEIAEDGDETSLGMHVQKALYDVQGSELLLSSYMNILRAVAKQGDKVRIEMLESWDEDECKRALEVGNGPNMQLEWPVTVAHRIDQVIAQHPDFIALKDGNGHTMTYAAMDERIESIASVLREQLFKNDNAQVIGVFQMPSNDYICSMLAINRIGAIYLPLDLRNGAPRLKSNVKAARPVAILTDSETVERIDEIGIVKQMVVINVSELHATAKMKRQDTAARPDRTAYIIFTSGSTGEPKGITVKHTGLMANIEGFHREWDVANLANVMLQQSAFSFDASLLQIYAPLTTGGCLLVVPADARGDPQEVTRLMVEHGVTMTQATPSEYDMWFRFAPDNLRRCTAWKAAFFGGERATSGLLEEFRNLSRLLPNLRLLTSYGPTEVSISAIKGEVDLRDPHVTVPIPGRLLPNYAAYIVDGEMRPVPVGVPGEIIIGGLGVGQNEYLDQPELTAKAFITDRFATHQKKETGWGRMYRTGDYGRLNARGYLSIEGRIAGDTQVKLRGFRIELTEIERVILQEDAGTITHAVVTLRGEGEEASFLAAHIVLEEKSEEGRGRIIDRLRARLPLCLPQYMCPGVIVALDEIPLTTHDKVDRRAVQKLSLPKIEAKSAIEQQQSLTQTERRLARLWTELLHPHTSSAAPLTQQSDFFLDGGNSMLLVKLQASIKCEFGDAPRLSKLMSAPGLASMAALLDSVAATVDWDKEMALGSLMDEIPVQPRRLTGSDGLRIVLTGATGHLGRRILAHLAADKRVSHIVCLVRPAKERDLTNLFPGIESKVHVMSADLPFIPTTHPELSAVDTVVHCAANRSFWDSYNVVKSVNVDTVKLLAEFCLRTGASLHVLSSGAVTAYETDGDAASSDSSNPILPRPNPNDGYLSSKWVAERYLARAARLTGLRATVHRPTAATPPDSEDPGEKVTEMEADFVRSMVFVAPKIGVQPDFAPLSGSLDIMDLEDMTEAVAAVIMSEAEQQNENELRIVDYPATARVRTDALAACTDNLLRHVENEAVRMLPAVPGLEFVGLAKRAGLFGFACTSHELYLADGKGQMVVTRR